MSTDIIADVSNTILKCLQDKINLGGNFLPPIDTSEITLFSPASNISKSSRLCLFLYQIVENQYMKNIAMERMSGNEYKYQPLVLDLHYILMPYKGGEPQANISTIEEHRLMGKAMQILYDNRTITTLDTWDNNTMDLEIPIKLAYNPVSLDDMSKLWQSIHNSSYRPSVCYIASPVIVESAKLMVVNSITESSSKLYKDNLANKEEE